MELDLEPAAPDPSFWSGRRVLLTGHTGFKGAWLSLWLHELGARASGYSRSATTSPSLFELARLGELVDSVLGELGDLAAVRAALAATEPQVVFHMAAQPLVRRSYEDPVGTFASNAMGTVHVLEAVRHTPSVRVLVNITTDKVYENREWEWGYRESDTLGGSDPYASSKACAELITAAYRQSFFGGADAARIATARAGNVIGGGDWAADRLVPDLLRGAQSGTAVEIRNPYALRPWQHVLNPLSGYLLLAERLWEDPRIAGPWNFGPLDDDVRPVGEIADRLAELWGEGLRWRTDNAEHPPETAVLKLDSSRSRAHLRWGSRWDLDDALRAIVEFERGRARGDDTRGLMQGQLKQFAGAG